MRASVFTICFIFLLSACSTSINSTRIDKQKPLEANHGVVGVQVINNTDTLARHHKAWTEVIVVRIDNFKEKQQQAIDKAKSKAKRNKVIDEAKVKWQPDYYTLSPSREGVIDSQVFIGSMPQGRYIISSLYSFFNGGDYSSQLSMPVGYSIGTFEVKNSELTNLGSIVFQPLLNIKEASFWSQRSSQKAYVTRVNEYKKLDQYVLSQYPLLEKAVDLTSVNGWQEDSYASFRKQLSELSRENAYGKTALVVTDKAKGVIASKFGQLKILNEQGDWQQVNLETNGQLAAILELDDKIMVAGERGQLFIADGFDSDWNSISKVSPQEAIVWLGKNTETNFAMTQSLDQYKLYKFSSLEDEWKMLRTFKRKPSNIFSASGNIFPFIAKNGQLNVTNHNKRYVLNAQHNRWSEHKGKSLVEQSQLKTGSLVALEVSVWSGVGDQLVSQDSGVTWKNISRHLSSKDAVARNSLPLILQDGTVITLGRFSIKGKSKGELKVISAPFETINKRKTWKYHGEAKLGCQTLLPQVSSEQALYFLCDRGDIVSTHDLGKTWNTVTDIDLAQMQDSYDLLVEAIKNNKAQEQAINSEGKTQL